MITQKINKNIIKNKLISNTQSGFYYINYFKINSTLSINLAVRRNA